MHGFTLKVGCDCLCAGVEFQGGEMFGSIPGDDVIFMKVC